MPKLKLEIDMLRVESFETHPAARVPGCSDPRSEERRVGKEARCLCVSA